MGNVNNLATTFAKIIKEDATATKDSTVYGTAVEFNGKMYVKLDGSERMTPIETTTSIKEGDRVTVLIKAHSAIVTGNVTDPSTSASDKKATDDKVKDLSAQVSELGTVVAGKVSTEQLQAAEGRITNLEADNVNVKNELKAHSASITNLDTKKASVDDLKATNAAIDNLETKMLTTDTLDAKYATIKNLEATDATIHNLSVDYGTFKQATVDDLKARKAEIDDLATNKLNATDAELKYANIDFSNIGVAAIEQFYATSGIIKDLVIGDQTVTGEIVGVTIKGDLIEGNTIVADKLVMKGDDGLFYKLNISAANGVNAEQTSYNSINGNIITAKSITATQISVKDLVAFDATIAGFHIKDTAIYSTGKESVTSTVRGIYLSKDGQLGFGDGNNYIKFYVDTDGKYKLGISAESLTFSTGQSVKDAINEVDSKVDAIKSIDSTTIGYLVGDNGTTPPTGIWSAGVPVVPNGKYLWCQKITTYTDGSHDYEYSVSRTGDKGETGPKGDKGQSAGFISDTSFSSNADGWNDGGNISSHVGYMTISRRDNIASAAYCTRFVKAGTKIYFKMSVDTSEANCPVTLGYNRSSNSSFTAGLGWVGGVSFSRGISGTQTKENVITISSDMWIRPCIQMDGGTNFGTANVYYAEMVDVTGANKLVEPKADKANIISTINVSQEAVKIQGAKIDLLGQVSFSCLDSSAQSVINAASANASSALNNFANYTPKTIPDTRSTNQTPQWYCENYPQQVITEFKQCTSIGLEADETFCTLRTEVPWMDSSGGWPKQIVSKAGRQLWRCGTSATTWSSWIDAGAWCYANDKSYIDGGKIYTGTITADKLNVKTLSALCADLGTVTAGTIMGASGEFTKGFKVSVPKTVNNTAYNLVIDATTSEFTVGLTESHGWLRAGMNMTDQGNLNIVSPGAITCTASHIIMMSGEPGMPAMLYVDKMQLGSGPILKIVTQARQVTQSRNSDNYWSFTDAPIKDKYTRIVCDISFSGTNSSYMNAYCSYYEHDYVKVFTRNYGSNTFSGTMTVTVLYVNNASTFE